MKQALTALLLTLLCLSSLFGDPKPAITGQITDSSGAVISNARVVVHWDSSGRGSLKDNIGITQDVVTVTDSSGHCIATVPAGFYDVFVSAMAFTPIATKVRVKEGQPSAFSAKLAIDPVISKELGDEVYSTPR